MTESNRSRSSGKRKSGASKSGRRAFVKTGVAVTGGIAMGAAYVRPEIASAAVLESANASGSRKVEPSVRKKVTVDVPKVTTMSAESIRAGIVPKPVTGTAPHAGSVDTPGGAAPAGEIKPSASTGAQSTFAGATDTGPGAESPSASPAQPAPASPAGSVESAVKQATASVQAAASSVTSASPASPSAPPNSGKADKPASGGSQ